MQKGIERVALRDLIHRNLLERILHGKLSPGSRIKDTELSKELDVSRTPVREALLRLVKEGFLENLVGKGFVVRPLTGCEVREIYPVISALEILALKNTGTPTKKALKQLETFVTKMGKTGTDFIRTIELDVEWHRVLLSSCSNNRLLDMISDLKSIAFRYEYAFMQNLDLVEQSIAEHRKIIMTFIEEGVGAAIPLLEKHWEFSKNALLEKLERE
ncbi:MAG: GntR family transcriptional regulator [bacterium]|nr:GntR family transcriptional regulator [bacterium]